MMGGYGYGDDDRIEDDEERDLGPGEGDYDLSEEHGYTWEPGPSLWRVPPSVMVAVSVLVILALVLPSVLILWQYR